ncbi:MAG: arsenate reductase family protein [Paludibacter sp.]|nr:arsenate reductase family protein [Paludibacter sp.]
MLIHFYEKPGCINNTKQKRLLELHGHRVEAHSLLEQRWNAATLRMFFGDTPIAEWFNMAAPRIKSNEISPGDFDEDTAIDAMLEDPLLIRRPLIDAHGELACGFDHPLVKELLGGNTDVSGVLTCPNMGTDTTCD